MFKNSTVDPLAVPTPVRRTSVGPRRTANDYAGNGPNSAWLSPDEGYQHPEEARQRYIEEHGEPYTHPVHGPGHLKQGPLGKEFIPNDPGHNDFSEFGDEMGSKLFHPGGTSGQGPGWTGDIWGPQAPPRTAGVPWAETKLPGLKQHEQQDLDYQSWEQPGDDPGPYGGFNSASDEGEFQQQQDMYPPASYTSESPGYADDETVDRIFQRDQPHNVGPYPGEYGPAQPGAILGSKPRDRAGDAWADGKDRASADAEDYDTDPDNWEDRTARRLARDFLAQDHGTDNAEELLIRAERHAAAETSTWSVEASRRATQAFCARVAALIPAPKKVAAVPVTTVEDFDDALLY